MATGRYVHLLAIFQTSLVEAEWWYTKCTTNPYPESVATAALRNAHAALYITEAKVYTATVLSCAAAQLERNGRTLNLAVSSLFTLS